MISCMEIICSATHLHILYYSYYFPNWTTGGHNITPSESDRFIGNCFVIHQLKKVAAELLRVVHQVV